MGPTLISFLNLVQVVVEVTVLWFVVLVWLVLVVSLIRVVVGVAVGWLVLVVPDVVAMGIVCRVTADVVLGLVLALRFAIRVALHRAGARGVSAGVSIGARDVGVVVSLALAGRPKEIVRVLDDGLGPPRFHGSSGVPAQDSRGLSDRPNATNVDQPNGEGSRHLRKVLQSSRQRHSIPRRVL